MAKVFLSQSTFTEMFGVMSISATLKNAGHDVSVSNSAGKALIREALEFSPDVIGISAVSMNIHSNLQNAAAMKRALPHIPVIAGGVHTTFFPETIDDPSLDAICRGEGEFALIKYVEAVCSKSPVNNIEGIWTKENGSVVRNPLPAPISNLDELPFPDRGIYYSKYRFLRDNPVKNFLCSRGCPFGCSFCFNETYREIYSQCGHTLKPRMRSPENVIAEIEWFKAKWPLQKLAFQDENFCLDKKWLAEFLPEYAARFRLPFFCMLNAAIADEELIVELKRAGCHHTTFGVESGDEELRRKILNKKVTDEQIIRTAALLRKHGITFHTTNIFSFPGETFESAVRTLTFNAKINPDSTIAFRFMPFANLELTAEALRAGYLESGADRDWKNLPTAVIKVPGYKRIYRLRLMFGAGVRRPALIPLIVALSKLPVGPVATVVFYALDAFSYYYRNRHDLRFMLSNVTRLGRLYKSFMKG